MWTYIRYFGDIIINKQKKRFSTYVDPDIKSLKQQSFTAMLSIYEKRAVSG